MMTAEKRRRNIAVFKSCPTQSRGSFLASLFILFSIIPALGCSPTKEPVPLDSSSALNILTAEEKEEGWILLFDGRSFSGWRGLGREAIPKGHWTIEDGAIKKVPSIDVPLQADGQPLEGGDILTVRSVEHFELRFEWKISHAGNSGIKYNVSEELSTSYPPPNAALGFEYQILDDDHHPDALNGETRTAGALYYLIPPRDKILKPVGEYNQSRIIFRGNHGEHWLNGVKILEYDLGTAQMEERLAASKYNGIAGFADKRRGHIVLQDHTDAVWFRNLKLKEYKNDVP